MNDQSQRPRLQAVLSAAAEPSVSVSTSQTAAPLRGAPQLKVVQYYPSAADVDRLVEEFGKKHVVNKLDPAYLRNLIFTAAHEKGEMPGVRDVWKVHLANGREAPKPRPVDPERINQLQAQVKANEAAEKARGAAKPSTKVSGFSAQWEGLTTEAKVNVGLSGAAAMIAGIGALKSLSRAVRKDEQGNTKIDASNVGIGLVMAAFAVGSGYLAMAQMRAGVVAR